MLRTGWTPGRVASLPARLRRALHWRLWLGAVFGPDGLPPLEAPAPGSDPKAYREYGSAKAARDALYAEIFPEGA